MRRSFSMSLSAAAAANGTDHHHDLDGHGYEVLAARTASKPGFRKKTWLLRGIGLGILLGESSLLLVPRGVFSHPVGMQLPSAAAYRVACVTWRELTQLAVAARLGLWLLHAHAGAFLATSFTLGRKDNLHKVLLWVHEHTVAGLVIFGLLYVWFTVMFLPPALLAACAGALYGLLKAIPVVWACAVVSSSTCQHRAGGGWCMCRSARSAVTDLHAPDTMQQHRASVCVQSPLRAIPHRAPPRNRCRTPTNTPCLHRKSPATHSLLLLLLRAPP